MFKLVLTLLTMAIFVTAKFGFVKRTQRLQATCWGPGVWSHPEDCTLFSVCVLDLQGNVKGQLYQCPANQVYSTMYRRCTPRQLAPNCTMANMSTEQEAAFSAHRILSDGEEPLTSKQHTCRGATVPYCADSDTLVVCGPNKARIGIVQCAGKTLDPHKEQRETRCVRSACVHSEEESTEHENFQSPEHVSTAAPPGRDATTQRPESTSYRRNDKSLSMITENGDEAWTSTNATEYSSSKSNDSSSNNNKDEHSTGDASENEQAGSCKVPGFQCADDKNATLIECSNNLTVIGEWECENVFPLATYDNINSIRIECDSQHGSCFAFIEVRDTSDTEQKVWGPSSDVDTSPQETHSQDISRFRCSRNGIQCADEKTIMSCTDHDSEPAFVMSCSDMIQILDNEEAVGYCDDKASACVLAVNQFKIPLELSLFDSSDRQLECKQGNLYCADNDTLVACSGDSSTENYAISCGSRDGKDAGGPLAYCNSSLNSCIIDSDAVDPLEQQSSTQSLSTNYNGNELLTNYVLLYSCKQPGWQCINDETIVLCSSDLEVHGYYSCSEALNTSKTNAVCDTTENKCLFREATTTKPPSPHCRVHGAQCLGSEHLAFCTPDLQLDHILPCVHFYPNDPHPFCNKIVSACLPSALLSTSSTS